MGRVQWRGDRPFKLGPSGRKPGHQGHWLRPLPVYLPTYHEMVSSAGLCVSTVVHPFITGPKAIDDQPLILKPLKPWAKLELVFFKIDPFIHPVMEAWRTESSFPVMTVIAAGNMSQKPLGASEGLGKKKPKMLWRHSFISSPAGAQKTVMLNC